MIQQFKCVHNLNRLRIFSWNDSQGGHLIKLGNKYKQFIIFFNIYRMSDYYMYQWKEENFYCF